MGGHATPTNGPVLRFTGAHRKARDLQVGHTGRRRMARMTKMAIWPWKWGGMWPGRVSASKFEYSLAFEKEKAELTHGCAFQNYQKSLHNTAISSHHVTWPTLPELVHRPTVPTLAGPSRVALFQLWVPTLLCRPTNKDTGRSAFP